MAKPNLEQWFSDKVGAELLEKLSWNLTPRSQQQLEIEGKSGGRALLSQETGRAADPGGTIPLILVTDDDSDDVHDGVFEVVPEDVTANKIVRVVTNAHELARLRSIESVQDVDIKKRDYVLRQLIEIGKSLSAVKDIDELLVTILEKARYLAGADAGSIYVVEGHDDDIQNNQLRFKLSQNDSIEYKSEEFVMPISTQSIAGAAAVMANTINIANVRELPEDAPYHYDSSFDERTGYRTISVLAVPMINQEGRVMGVVQLLNKKRTPSSRLDSPEAFDKEVISVDDRTQEIVETLAAQAGVTMENAFLYDEITRIFDGFVRASVHAIEQRDPTTSGHSFRVAALTKRLAQVVDSTSDGPFKSVSWSKQELREIEVAALLHDFGKVGVREEVLVKAKKLYGPNLQNIRARFDYIRRSIENDFLHRRLMMVEEGAPKAELAILEQASGRALAELEECWRIIGAANEPTVLPEGDFNRIEEVAKRSYFDVGGMRQPYLEGTEVKSLQVAKGSLTPEELVEIRSHVRHTISFLQQIPWGRSLRNVPAFAGAHHEKLDGSGYPYGIKEEEIPLPAKLMCIADIYDALTAADRPYKKAVPLDRAFHILDLEAKDYHIDATLLEMFKVAKVYEATQDNMMREVKIFER